MAPSTFTVTYTNSSSLSTPFTLTRDVPTTTSTSSEMSTSDRAAYLHSLRQIAATFQDDINRELTQRMEEDNKRAAAAAGTGGGNGGRSKEEEEAVKEEENYGEEVVEEDE